MSTSVKSLAGQGGNRARGRWRWRLVAGGLFWLTLAPFAGAVGAQTTAATPAAELTRPGMQVERARLRTELDRVNAEIDGIKRGQRSVRDDYRLRTRLADAEAIARRLTEIEARISRLDGKPDATTTPMRLGAAPGAAPTDGPAELEAKADILADQSRRLAAQAESLTVRLGQVKGRQELRRRAGQLERDPFAPLEGSKRRAVSGTPTGGPGAPNGVPKGGPSVIGEGATTTTTPTAPAVGVAGGAPAPRGPGDMSTPPGFAAGTGSRGLPGGAASPTPMTATGAIDSVGSLSTQLRDVLDAGALADIRRLEGTGAPGSSIAAMERAIAALKARAERLQAQSDALRPK